MKAILLHGRGGPEHLVYEDVPQPHPGPGEVLVRVSATGDPCQRVEMGRNLPDASGEEACIAYSRA
jgi:hypothetical protein